MWQDYIFNIRCNRKSYNFISTEFTSGGDDCLRLFLLFIFLKQEKLRKWLPKYQKVQRRGGANVILKRVEDCTIEDLTGIDRTSCWFPNVLQQHSLGKLRNS